MKRDNLPSAPGRGANGLFQAHPGEPKAALGNLGLWTLAIGKHAADADADGFRVLPRADPRLAQRNRRLAKEFEASIASAESWIMSACVKLPSRRLART